MEIMKFVQHFAAQFDETPIERFSANFAFREVDEWSSLTALCIIAMIDEEYEVELNGDDIRSSKTIQDIYNKVKAKLTNA